MTKELVMFMVSMSDTMGTLVPPPIEMNPHDENNNNECKSRWATCAEIIKLIVDQLPGSKVDLAIAKNSDLGVIITRGNSEEKRGPIVDFLHTMMAGFRTNGRANPEFAVKEIEKLNENPDFSGKEVHWFIDTETFSNFDPAHIKSHLEDLTIYVVGKISSLHDNFEATKRFSSVWTCFGATLKFLVSSADFEDLKKELEQKTLLGVEERTIDLFVGPEKIEVQVQETVENGKSGWSVDTLSVVGFVCDLELQRLDTFKNQTENDTLCHVSAVSTDANDVLWSLASYMLSDPRRPMSCLCAAFDKTGGVEEHCILVTHTDESRHFRMSLIRLGQLLVDLKVVEKIGEASEPLPDNRYVQFAPADFKIIRHRLSKMEEVKIEKRKELFDEWCGEYSILDGEDEFLAFTEQWQKDFL